MKDFCVPIPGLNDNEYAEITLNISGRKKTINYKIESFLWDSEEDYLQGADEVFISLARIERLKKAIRDYDKQWELIQIFTPAENAKSIQVLYRKK